MPDEQQVSSEDLPTEISREAAREKSIRHGLPTALHRWWARRPAVLARVATYLALTEGQTPDLEFLAALGGISPGSATINQARSHVRDTQWRWVWRENQHSLDEGVDQPEEPRPPEAPRVPDPFAGGGSIPAEAARLGCQAYAGDLSPVAYHILRASLEFPAAYIRPDSAIAGNSPAGTWGGLAEELSHWARRMESITGARVSPLFPAAQGGNVPAPSRYLWFNVTQCLNPKCGAAFPLQRSLRLTRGDAQSSAILFEVVDEAFTPRIIKIPGSSTRGNGKQVTCPFCGLVCNLSELKPGDCLERPPCYGSYCL